MKKNAITHLLVKTININIKIFLNYLKIIFDFYVMKWFHFEKKVFKQLIFNKFPR